MPLSRVALCLGFLAALAAASACGGASPSAEPMPTHPPPTPIEFRSCDPAGEAFQIVTHGDGLEKYIQPVDDALALARQYSAQNYGWQPSTPVCVHLFSRSAAFVEGLQQAGWGKNVAEEYRIFWGTVGTDPQTGLDAAYIDVGVIGVPKLAAGTAVHEYFHIVQSHIGGTVGSPVWFTEGMAAWAASKVMGTGYSNWLALAQEDVRAGRDAPLSSLTTWQQYREFAEKTQNSVDPFFFGFKVRAAFMLMEELAGPTAPARILRGSEGRRPTSFEEAFQEVTGLTLPEFEARLRDFIMEQPP